MDEQITSGVDAGVSESEAAAQTDTVDTNTDTGSETPGTPNETGVESEEQASESPAAGDTENADNDRVEKAFAKRLAAETEKIRRETAQLVQTARDALIKEQGYEWQGKPITTEAEYKQALREQEIMQSLQDKDLPEEVINELVESRRFREEYAKQQQQINMQKRIESDLHEFMQTYPDVKTEDIAPEVFDLCNKGISLLDAYNRIEIPKKLAKMQQALEIKQKNAENAGTSPGSMTGNGATPPDYISPETFEQNRGNQDWVNKNFNKIMQSRPKWK